MQNFTGKDLDIPKSYIELLKLAGQVRRPFHSQAVALISLCRMLVTEFEKDDTRTSDNLTTLEECVRCDSLSPEASTDLRSDD